MQPTARRAVRASSPARRPNRSGACRRRGREYRRSTFEFEYTDPLIAPQHGAHARHESGEQRGDDEPARDPAQQRRPLQPAIALVAPGPGDGNGPWVVPGVARCAATVAAPAKSRRHAFLPQKVRARLPEIAVAIALAPRALGGAGRRRRPDALHRLRTGGPPCASHQAGNCGLIRCHAMP